jgi:hypothetical protein
LLASIALITGLLIYFFGKKKNIKLMDDTTRSLEEENGKQALKLKLVEESTVGRTFLVKVKEGLPFTNFRIHFTLINRHLILSLIASILRRRRDHILLEANPKDKIVNRFQLEILPLKEQKGIKTLSDMLLDLEPVEIKTFNLNDIYIIRTNDSELIRIIFQTNRDIAKRLYLMRNHIIRVSFYPLENPSLRLVAKLNEQLITKPLIDIILNLTTGITTIAKKGYLTKDRKAGLRIYRDKTVEKDKEKRYKRIKV